MPNETTTKPGDARNPLDSPVSLGTTTVNIKECPVCKSKHEDIALTEFKTGGYGPFTHWYLCPSTGDPAMLSLISIGDGVGIDIDHNILSQVLTAQASGRYMVAVWRVTERDMTPEELSARVDGDDAKSIATLELMAPTWKNMPVGPNAKQIDLYAAIELLRKVIERQMGMRFGTESPLAAADVTPEPPEVRMFGRGD